MSDRIFAEWLEVQATEGMDLASRSDVLRLAPVAGLPPHKFLAEFSCRGLAKTDAGIVTVDRHLVGISYPPDFLRRSSDPWQVLTWLEPQTEFHPNIRFPAVCVGHIAPGMTLVSLLHQLWQMITWQRFTPRENDALNKEACAWARRNLDRFPVDSRRSLLGGPRLDSGAGAGEPQ